MVPLRRRISRQLTSYQGMELLVQSDTRPSKVYLRIEEFLRNLKVRSPVVSCGLLRLLGKTQSVLTIGPLLNIPRRRSRP